MQRKPFFTRSWPLRLLMLLFFVGIPLYAQACKVKNESTGATYTDLQTAIDDANGGATLKMKGTCAGTFMIGNDLILKGEDDATLDGEQLGTVLTITGGTSVVVKLENLTIQNGSGINGGGIRSNVTLTLKDVKLLNNVAQLGAGAFLSQGDNTLIKCHISHNVATDVGGGLLIDATRNNRLYKCHIAHNSASADGGALHVSNSTIAFTHVNFKENLSQLGGAIFQTGADTAFNHCEFNENRADSDGGAFYNALNGHANFNSTIFFKNNAGLRGGALFNSSNGAANFNDSKVKKNIAGVTGGGIFNSSSDPAFLNIFETEVEDNSPNDIANS